MWWECFNATMVTVNLIQLGPPPTDTGVRRQYHLVVDSPPQNFRYTMQSKVQTLILIQEYIIGLFCTIVSPLYVNVVLYYDFYVCLFLFLFLFLFFLKTANKNNCNNNNDCMVKLDNRPLAK